MKKIYRYLVAGLGMLLLGTTVHANADSMTANTANSTSSASQNPSLSIPELEVGQKVLTGEATKGITVTVRADNAKKTKIASATASKTTGKYTIKLPKGYSAYTKLYVYAQNNGSYNYFYRILTVKPKGTYTKNSSNSSNSSSAKNSSSKTSSSANKNSSKTNTTATSSTSNSKVTIQEPTGTWQSNSIKGAYTQYIFSQNNGLNEITYNGKQSKTVLKNASYQVIPHSNVFWEIKYREHGQSKYTSIYVHFNTNYQFYLTNDKDQVASSSSDNTFNRIK